MRVKRLTIRSFRGVDDLTLEFDPIEPTVLIGINGSGKSSLLGCVALLLSHLAGIISQLLQGDLGIETQGKTIKYPYFILTEEDIKNGFDKAYHEITIVYNNQEITWSITTTRGINTVKFDYDFSGLKAFGLKLHKQLEQSSATVIPLLVCYTIHRGVLKIPLKVLENDSFEMINIAEDLSKDFMEKQINFESFFRWFRFLEDLENEERRDNPEHRNKKLEAVRQAIYSLQPDLSDLKVKRSPLRMTVLKAGHELIVNQLSDGEKCLLAMVGDLARRLAAANPNLVNPLQGFATVLIDEIELHLHPQWQRGIIPKLAQTFPNCQFIATTHSPQVISDIKPNGIYILESTPDGIKAKRPESSFGKDSNSILEDLMGVPERPQNIKNELRHLFRLIDEGNLEEARKIQEHLEELIGSDEPEFSRADFLIRRKEILGR